MHFTIRVQTSFNANHNLRKYYNKEEKMHSHQWKVEAYLGSDHLNREGMVEDFLEIKKTINLTTKPLHNAYINEFRPFHKVNPTTENIALWIFKRLNAKLKNAPYQLEKITLWETPNFSATIAHR